MFFFHINRWIRNAAHQAVRATHLPTGISVHCTSSQSQFDARPNAAGVGAVKGAFGGWKNLWFIDVYSGLQWFIVTHSNPM